MVDEECVYFCSCDGHLYCLNQTDGKQRLEVRRGSRRELRRAIYSVPILDGSTLYFAAGEGQAYAVDKASGKQEWKIRPSEDSELFCSPATDGNLLFFVTRATLKKQGEPSLLAIGVK